MIQHARNAHLNVASLLYNSAICAVMYVHVYHIATRFARMYVNLMKFASQANAAFCKKHSAAAHNTQ
jgi:hypothetical protein